MATIIKFPVHSIGGPFYIGESTDGVDNTFEIIGYGSGKVVARTRYWEARDAAYDDATLLTLALNAYLYGWKADKLFNHKLVKEFRQDSPGPFVFKFESDDLHPCHLIIDDKTKMIVHAEHGSQEDETYRNTRLLILALNHLYFEQSIGQPSEASKSILSLELT